MSRNSTFDFDLCLGSMDILPPSHLESLPDEAVKELSLDIGEAGPIRGEYNNTLHQSQLTWTHPGGSGTCSAAAPPSPLQGTNFIHLITSSLSIMDFSISSSSFNILWKYEGVRANIYTFKGVNHIFRNVIELERKYNLRISYNQVLSV